jgi:hypothetical protein
MDRWLDEMARLLARGASRKEFLRLTGAALGGSLLRAATPAPVAAQKQKGPTPLVCRENFDCVLRPYDSLECCNGACCKSGDVCGDPQW